jgi:metallo-beta-lactamase class B
VDPKDIRYVLITHGHFDHTGGAYKLKPLTNARFVMTRKGWNEAIADAQKSEKTPRPWKMIATDRVVKDGDAIRVGDQVVRVCETPGHTWCRRRRALQGQHLLPGALSRWRCGK